MDESISLLVKFGAIILVISFLASLGVIKYLSKHVVISYKISLIIFFIFYLFVIEFRTIYWWSIWSNPPLSIIIENLERNNSNDIHSKFISIFESISSALMIFSIPIFIYTLNSNVKNSLTRTFNWIPLLNLITITATLKKININLGLITVWSFFTTTWCFYRFIAPLLLYNGIDTYKPLRKLIYDGNYEIDYPFDLFTLNIETAFIVLPVLLYFSGITSFIIFHNLSKPPTLHELDLANKYNVIDDERT